jgi:WhiB family redox-sensing transcriptional regulator
MKRARRLFELTAAQDWRADAACRGMDPELFFPSAGDVAGAEAARQVCAGCPVRAQCLDYALRAPETRGVWGGETDRERRTIRKKRGYAEDRGGGAQRGSRQSAETIRQRRERLGTTIVADVNRHGTAYAYLQKKCKCDDCRDWALEASRRRRARGREAPQHTSPTANLAS